MNELNEFNVGGSHKTNPLGGIPLGINPQSGVPITVEEGETKTKIAGQSFIFSNNYKVNKSIIKDFNLPSNLEGLTMSDASKKIDEIFEDRNDGISSNTKNQFLTRLSEAQESLKEVEYQKVQQALMRNMNTMDESLPNEEPKGIQEFTNESINNDSIMPEAVIPQQQMNNGGMIQQQGWFGTTQGAGIGVNSNTAASNVAGAASGIMGLLDQAQGNTSPDPGKSALMGAASGAAVGTMIFPGIGTAVGAGVGAIAGAVGGSAAQRKQTNRLNKAAMAYNSQFQEQFASGGPIPLGGMLTNNMYGGYGNNKPQVPFYGFKLPGSNQTINPFQSNTIQGVGDEMKYYGEQNPLINAQNFLLSNNYNLTGGADGKWGPSSQAGLDAWRKSQGMNITGPITSQDYQRMGYNNQGYIPYENNELDPLVINVDNTQPINNFANSPVTVTSDDPNKPNNNRQGFNANQMMRMMTPLGNAIQLGSLQEPTMGNPYVDMSKARRDYIDEAAMIKNVRNQGNTLNRAIQNSGMSESTRRSSMLAANLNTQNALGNAFIQAQQANRAIDAQADAIDAQTRAGNTQRRMLADENYARDLGAYNTEKSKLQSQIFTDIGNIGLENSRINKVETVFGYRVNGDYIENNQTGEKYDSSQLKKLIEDYGNKAKEAKTDFDKDLFAKEQARYQKLYLDLSKARAPRETTNKPTKTNK